MANKVAKPDLSFWQIWNLSFGFLGVQFGFALQNGNVSRILQALGADVHDLGYFWLAAPIAGIIIQPIIGGASDSTWTKLGRRVPFILGGAIAATLAMFLMPNSEFFVALMPPMLFGATMLLIMDASFNITFQPFRALVGDMVNDKQRDLGYSVQSFLINTGAVVGSALPFILTMIGVNNEPAEGQKVADSVVWSFYIGGATLMITVLWTVLRTKEYPPEEYAEYNNIDLEAQKAEKEQQAKDGGNAIANFIKTLISSPKVMFQLAAVQLCSWVAFYFMWVYSTPAIAQHIWHTAPGDVTSAAYNDAGNWVGLMFAMYSFAAAIFSVLMPSLIKATNRKTVYASALILGGLGLLSIGMIQDKYLLFVSMAGVGIAWAAILAMPFSILSENLPAEKMGIYMGIFNVTIAGPQIFAGLFGGTIASNFFDGNAVGLLTMAGVILIIGAFCVGIISDNKDKKLEQ
ncbi:MFS transporter [Flammeovirga kamogawensis]|uniref:MFS transporter n=1 Tax=Flammeovirga kamogawensis TaxID=373891 RepID=A0ABX8GTF6_9BACT|nr:MFS transporter [Flammeovirga kamogawensis]MBB6462997.1 maltose/moltooligosaccharide transporter [Flammeovirga kamogawensis]QWG06522.1 MFS transporter [Flammeovirga kamogawensis]TRX68350.1 SLC45 family MFS transporter [Flammeovirga kamogawensis]